MGHYRAFQSFRLGILRAWELRDLPIVSIVVPFWGLPFRILYIELVKPKKGTTMETLGRGPGPGVWPLSRGDCVAAAPRSLPSPKGPLGFRV